MRCVCATQTVYTFRANEKCFIVFGGVVVAGKLNYMHFGKSHTHSWVNKSITMKITIENICNILSKHAFAASTQTAHISKNVY